MVNGRSKLDEEGCEFGRSLNARMNNLEKQLNDMQKVIHEIREQINKRLPLWASTGFAAAGLVIGSMATIIAI